MQDLHPDQIAAEVAAELAATDNVQVPARIVLDELYRDDVLAVTMLVSPDAPRSGTIVSFSGIGNPKAGPPREYFFEVAQTYRRAIFVIDLTRSWGNNFSLRKVARIIRRHGGPDPVHVVGHSMGGFLALAFSHYHPVQSAFVSAPQFSVHPDIVPDETRWRAFTSQITRWTLDKVERGPVPDYRINILFGTRNDDRLHRDLFRALGWGRIYALANGDHSLPHELKEMGILKEIALSALAGELSQARLDVILGERRLLGKKKRRELKRNPRPPKPPKRKKVPKPPKPLVVRVWKRMKKLGKWIRLRLFGPTPDPQTVQSTRPHYPPRARPRAD